MTQRQKNLRLLAHQWGGLSRLAEKLHLSGPSFLSQMANGLRPITEKTARKIETAFDLPAGWMDQEHAIPEKPVRIDEPCVRQAVLAVGAVLEEEGVSVPPVVFADLVELVYEDATRKGGLDMGYVTRVVRLTRR